jgi:DNA-binding NarL/FixJ family response regulator
MSATHAPPKARVDKNRAEQRATVERRLPGYTSSALGGLGLSRRELAVLERVAEGRTNEEIARALELSPLTVKKHLERMSLKLSAANRAALVAVAWQRSADPSAFPRRGAPRQTRPRG